MQIKKGMANSVDPDQTAHDKPSHLDLHRLQKYMPLHLDTSMAAKRVGVVK